MDPFSHLLYAYLATFGIGVREEGYLLFAVIMGILPDIDIFMHPLSSRWKVLQHRLFTHTYPFIILSSLIGAFFVASAFKLNYFIMLFAGIYGGTIHILCDYITNKPVYPFFIEFKPLGIEKAINFFSIGISFALVIILWNFRVYNINYTIFLQVLSILYTILTIYFGIRIILRSYLTTRFKGAKIIPTSNPFSWWIIYIVQSAECRVQNYDGRVMLWNIRELRKARRWNINTEPLNENEKINTIEKALTYTYNVLMKDNNFLRRSFPVPFVVQNHPGKYTIFWYSVEFGIGKWFFGMLFNINEDRTIKTQFKSLKI